MSDVTPPVCTWQESDIDDMRIEGSKLVTYVAKASQKSEAKQREWCELIEQRCVCLAGTAK